jgi:hypothetical protein
VPAQSSGERGIDRKFGQEYDRGIARKVTDTDISKRDKVKGQELLMVVGFVALLIIAGFMCNSNKPKETSYLPEPNPYQQAVEAGSQIDPH